MRRVVVIDDDEAVVEMLEAVLASRGYQAMSATSGEAGIRLVDEYKPDAVVCDMRMPGMGGEEVLLVLKSRPRTSHIPIVIMTGYCAEELVGIGDAFIEKPFMPDTLVEAIEKLAA